MTTNRPLDFVRVLVVVVEALLISFLLVYLAEYAAVPLVRQAGGGVL
jgi:antibiotic biosynthesis monooxygenase (ABM) superfamily enzyme